MSNNALVRVDQAPLSLAPAQRFNADQIQVIKDTVCKDATDAELAHFIEVSQYSGLSPFTSPPEIYAIKRWNPELEKKVMTIQTGIDGLLLVAERSGKYEGMTPVYWCNKQGQWSEVWLDKGPPMAAKVGIYRRGFREPIWAVVRFDSFAQRKRGGDLTKQWDAMGDHMIGKCAIAQGLRRAFPGKLRGIHADVETGESMDGGTDALAEPRQAHVEVLPARQIAAAEPAPDTERDDAKALHRQAKYAAERAGLAIEDDLRIRVNDSAAMIRNKARQLQQLVEDLEPEDVDTQAVTAKHDADAQVIDAEATAAPLADNSESEPAAGGETPQPITAQSREILAIYEAALIKAGRYTRESLFMAVAALLDWRTPATDWKDLAEVDAVKCRKRFGDEVQDLDAEEATTSPDKPATGKKRK